MTFCRIIIPIVQTYPLHSNILLVIMFGKNKNVENLNYKSFSLYALDHHPPPLLHLQRQVATPLPVASKISGSCAWSFLAASRVNGSSAVNVFLSVCAVCSVEDDDAKFPQLYYYYTFLYISCQSSCQES